MKITYLIGDATAPISTKGDKLILHVCNDVFAWGAGFVLALSRKWDAPEIAYRSMDNLEMRQGYVQFIGVEKDITVCNMVAQNGIHNINNTKPINYYSIAVCLHQANKFAIKNNATIHAPRFGSGLAGGDWNIIENIIKQFVTVDVFIYDLPIKK